MTRTPLKTLNTNKPPRQPSSNQQQQQPVPQKLIQCPMKCGDTFMTRTDLEAHIIVSHDKSARSDHATPQTTLTPLPHGTLHLPEDSPMVQAGDELAKAVESILGTTGDGSVGNIDIDDINKMAVGAVISGAIDADDDGVVIEDSGIVETDAAVSAILGQQSEIKLGPGIVHPQGLKIGATTNGYNIQADDDDFEPKAIVIQPPSMKAAALINGIKSNGCM